MANRSMLFGANRAPGNDNSDLRIFALGEANYQVPWIFQVLTSAGTHKGKSICFRREDDGVIAGDARQGFGRLEVLRSKAPEGRARDAVDAAIAWLSKPEHTCEVYCLEPLEILVMDDDVDLTLACSNLLSEISRFDEPTAEQALNATADDPGFGAIAWSNILYHSPDILSDVAAFDRD
jgi:hypothetical protein